MLWMATEAQFILGLNSRHRKYLRKASIRHSFTNQSHDRILYVFLTDRRWSVIFLRTLYMQFVFRGISWSQLWVISPSCLTLSRLKGLYCQGCLVHFVNIANYASFIRPDEIRRNKGGFRVSPLPIVHRALTNFQGCH